MSKSAAASFGKRFTRASVAVSLCVLIGACDNDADAPHDGATASAATPAPTDANRQASASANAAQTDVQPDSLARNAPPAQIIQSPPNPQTAPLSASDGAASLSAVAPEPLATPVIHTVD